MISAFRAVPDAKDLLKHKTFGTGAGGFALWFGASGAQKVKLALPKY